MKDFRIFDDEPILIFCDNQSSIKLVQNLVFHARTKHIKIYYHFIKDKMLNREIDLNKIPTKNQIVNILTKSLSSSKFEFLNLELEACNLFLEENLKYSSQLVIL